MKPLLSLAAPISVTGIPREWAYGNKILEERRLVRGGGESLLSPRVLSNSVYIRERERE